MTEFGIQIGGAAVFDQMVESVSCYEPDGTIVYVNPALCQLLGRSRETLVGQNAWKIFPAARGNAFHEALVRVASSGNSEHFDFHYAARSLWYTSHVYFAEGRIWIVGSDVTEQKHAAARLEVLANTSRVLSEAASDEAGVFETVARHVAEVIRDLCVIRLLSADGTQFEQPVGIWDTDPDCRELLRATPSVAAGEAIGPEILRSGQPIVIANLDPRAVASRIAPSPRREIMERLGIHSVMMVPLKVQGQVIGLVSVCRRSAGTREAFAQDDLRLLEELATRVALVVTQLRTFNLLQANEAQLREAVSVRDEFLFIASHELRTPLTALALTLDSLRDFLQREFGDWSDTKIRKSVAMASKQTGRLSALIDALLDVSRIATGTLRLELEEFDIGALMMEIIERFGEQAVRAQSTITLHATGPAPGLWDKSRVDQALTNLLSNALKYGSGKPIGVSLGTDRGSVRIRIRDRGIGIAPEHRQRIFGRFERAVAANHYGGLGLGLYIANQIITVHGGLIEVESEQGNGTTFTVSLPQRTHDTEAQPEP